MITLMTIIFIAFCVFLLMFAAMSVGVIFMNKSIKGSCGGLSNLGLKGKCMICGKDDQIASTAHIPDNNFHDAAAESRKSSSE